MQIKRTRLLQRITITGTSLDNFLNESVCAKSMNRLNP